MAAKEFSGANKRKANMLLYVTLGSNDLARSKRFYDPVMQSLGLFNIVSDEADLGYGHAPSTDVRECRLWVLKPHLRLPANWGNGTMIAFAAPSRAAVDAFHAAAVANGGTDEGAPGLRPYSPNFYACYVRDPDGNKLSAVCEKPE
jgi:catechol 2,3-dioxygenase-like lactoylglutathione lyase family enzyme